VSVIILLLSGFRRRRGGVNLSCGGAVQSAFARRVRVQQIGRSYVMLDALGTPPSGGKKHIAALRRIYIPRALESKENFYSTRRRELISRRVIKRVRPVQGFFSSHF
jgi:hypothetical protein